MRLEYAEMGLHNFHIALGTTLSVLELYNIERFSNKMYRKIIYGTTDPLEISVLSEVYDKQYKMIFDKVDKLDYIIMNICNGDGWEKLCSFLGDDIPSAEFPHLGKRK